MMLWFSGCEPLQTTPFILFLDRDGVINEENPNFIRRQEDVKIYDDTVPALLKAQSLGFRLVIISNQSGLARGYIDLQTFWDIHQRIVETLARGGVRISAACYCPHHPDDGCSCRKPSPEMLLFTAELFGASMEKSIFIGDRLTDMEAALRAGCRGILIKRDLKEISPVSNFPVCRNLKEAVECIEKLL